MFLNASDKLENDIILLHQMENALVDTINRSKVYPKLLYVWDTCVNLLDEYKTFRRVGLEPRLARGLLAEIMCKYVLKHWANERGFDCRIFSNLLIPRIDGGTTQLDLLLISNDFSICIECKSLYGRLSITNGEVKTLKNTMKPWNQNQGHIMSVKEVLNKYDIYQHNLLYIFSFGSITEYVPEPERKLMVNINSMEVLNNIANDKDFYHRRSLTKADLDDIEETLKDYMPEVEQEVEHIEFVNALMMEKDLIK